MSNFINTLKFNDETVEEVKKNPSEITWENLGLALARESRYEESIVAYSIAASIDPYRGILYRYRGHRYISVRRFEEGVADLVLASRIIPENWDVWYHLGLGYFLLGRYEDAEKAYEICYEMSIDNDSKAAITNWLYATLRRLGKDIRAQEILAAIPNDGFEVVDSEGYYELLKIYKGVLSKDEMFQVLKDKEDFLQVLTIGFGLSNSYALDGNEEKRREVLEFVTSVLSGHGKYAFGYIAAEIDLENLRK